MQKNPSWLIKAATLALASASSPEKNSKRLPPSVSGAAVNKAGVKWLNALTKRAPGTYSATTALETLPAKSTALKVGASIGLLVSITIRPCHGPAFFYAAVNFDQLTATKADKLSGPRLLAMETAMPLRVNKVAIAVPIEPAPKIEIVLVVLLN